MDDRPLLRFIAADEDATEQKLARLKLVIAADHADLRVTDGHNFKVIARLWANGDLSVFHTPHGERVFLRVKPDGTMLGEGNALLTFDATPAALSSAPSPAESEVAALRRAADIYHEHHGRNWTSTVENLRGFADTIAARLDASKPEEPSDARKEGA